MPIILKEKLGFIIKKEVGLESLMNQPEKRPEMIKTNSQKAETEISKLDGMEFTEMVPDYPNQSKGIMSEFDETLEPEYSLNNSNESTLNRWTSRPMFQV